LSNIIEKISVLSLETSVVGNNYFVERVYHRLMTVITIYFLWES